MGMAEGVFHNKFKKYELRALCFRENGRFLTKYGHGSSVFYREWSFFTKYGHPSSYFFVKNRKKGILLTFLAHNAVKF